MSPATIEDPTNRYAPYFSAAGYLVYLITGVIGALMPPDSFAQALSWQIGSGGAITGNVIAGIWLARRGEDLAAAGFTMLGIVYGIYFASIVMEHIDVKLGAAAALLMIPAQILITFCRLFPIWVRLFGGLVCLLFLAGYCAAVSGSDRAAGPWQIATYVSAQTLAVVWSAYFLKAAKSADA